MDSKKKIVTMIGRRWFDKTYGNTYHTVTVLIDGKAEFTSPVTYGYGNQYIDTALDWFRKVYGTLSLKSEFEFSHHVSDVARKRDL